MKKEASFTESYDSKYKSRLESWRNLMWSEILKTESVNLYGLQVFECNQYIAD